MTKAFRCDQCDEYLDAVPFELYQVVDVEDEDDGGQEVEVLHFCTAQCLANYSTGLALDFPEVTDAPSA